jgi:prepilin-type processing-associated H-X9-DG protein
MTKRNDTLFEVLVVLAIVFLLFFFSIPALNKGREKSRRVNCESNLKQLGLAIMMYAEESRGRCPVDSEPPSLAGSWQLLGKHKYLSSPKVLLCPGDLRGFRPAESLGVLTASNISYSYVPDVIWQPTNSNAILALDRIYAATKGSHWPLDGNHGRRSRPRPISMHQGGNILFSDGHVVFWDALPSDLKDKDGVVRVLSP